MRTWYHGAGHLDHRPRDATGDGSKHRRSDVDVAAARWLRAAYCGDRPADDPEISPVLADLRGLPPTLIQVGSEDSSRPDAEALARSARRAEISVTLDLWPGLWHAWHYHRDLPEAAEALARAGRWLHTVTRSHR